MARPLKRGPGQPRRTGPNPAPPLPADIAPSLPPAQSGPPVESSSFPHISMQRDPDVRERTGMQIVAMRLTGMTEEEIAKTLGLSKATLAGYVYLCHKNGWLDLPTARESIMFNLLPKAVKNIYRAMDSEHRLRDGMEERTAVSLEVLKGTGFKEFDRVSDAVGATTVVAVKIEMPEGPAPTVREETLGGVPAYVDAEVK